MPVRLLFVVVSVGLLGFAPAPLPRKERPNGQPDLRGEWVLVRCSDGAGDAPLGELATYRIRITRDTIAFGPRLFGSWATNNAFGLFMFILMAASLFYFARKKLD